MDYRTYAAMAAKRAGIDPDLYARVITQESGWNPNAVSPVGAMGLSQVMPATARDPGFGVSPLTKPNDPYAQLDFGANYLSALVNHFGGDTTRALAAYNWGAGNAGKWDGSMDSLPEETRNYLSSILGGNITASSKGGAYDNGFGNMPAPPALEGIAASYFEGPRAGQTPDDVIKRQAERALIPDPMNSPGFVPMDQGFGATGPVLSTNDPAAAGEVAPEEKQRLIDKLFPDLGRDQVNDRLLAIGSGLLSGTNWSDGFAAAGQNLMGVVGSEKDQAFELARMQMDAQQRAALSAADVQYQAVGSVETSDGTIVDGVMFDPRRGYFKFGENGEQVMIPDARPLNRSDASGTKMVTGGILGDSYDSVTGLEGDLRTIDRIIPKLQDTTFGVGGLMTDLTAYIKTAAGSRNLSPEEFTRQLVKGELQGQIGSNKAVVGGTGVLTEQDAARIITYLGGDLSKIGDNPAVIVEMLKTQRDSKQREYEREHERYNSFRGTTGAGAWIELPKYTGPSLDGSNGTSMVPAAEDALRRYGI